MALLKLKIKINIFKEFQIVTPPYMDILEIILSVCAHVWSGVCVYVEKLLRKKVYLFSFQI